MRLKIDWASSIVRSKFTIFALFYVMFEGNFPSTSPRGAYICRGDLTEGFLGYEFGGLIFGQERMRSFSLDLEGRILGGAYFRSNAIPSSPHIRESEFRNPGNFCLWNRRYWALESGIQLKESGIPSTIGIQNPSSNDKYWNPEYPQRGIQNSRLSWIALNNAAY